MSHTGGKLSSANAKQGLHWRGLPGRAYLNHAGPIRAKQLAGSVPVRRGEVSNSPSASLGTWSSLNLLNEIGKSPQRVEQLLALVKALARQTLGHLSICMACHRAEPDPIDRPLDGLWRKRVQVQPVQRAFLPHWLVVLRAQRGTQLAAF